MPPEMFAPPPLKVTPPPGLDEPRLWVRKLVIWSKPGELVRSISLRPGLNIIWSPDPKDVGKGRTVPEGPGHGAGKTLVCRLLRYCLGEPHFAPTEQRRKIASAFKDGRVGAEIIIDKKPWVVVRSLGVLPHSVVIEGGTFEEALARESETGIDPLLDVLTRTFLSTEVANILAPHALGEAWLLALAWLTRDQECHLDGAMSWRTSESESGSPAKGIALWRTTNIVRALLRALTPQEHRLESAVDRMEDERKEAKKDRDLEAIVAEASIKRLAEALHLDPRMMPTGPLLGPMLRSVVDEQAEAALPLLPGGLPSMPDITDRFEAAMIEFAELKSALGAARKEQERAEKQVTRIAAEMPGLDMELYGAEHPACPICLVPVDRVLAEGCGLSHRLTDLVSVRARREKLLEDLSAAKREAAEAKARIEELEPQFKLAEQKRDGARSERVSADQLAGARFEALYRAQRAKDDIAELVQRQDREEKSSVRVDELEIELKEHRETLNAARRRHAPVFGALSERFGALVRAFLGADATGEIKNDGNGIHLNVDYGGKRSTPAINSMTVLSFDVSTLCRSIEGATHLPAFLVHDSPREADLGLSIYHQLFWTIRDLEGVGPAPLFQYIVTTTTRPPDEMSVEPWLRLELAGAPAKMRLLERDL